MPAMKAAKAAKGAPGMKGATALKPVDGRLVSKRSKTNNPACSQAMSTWVRSRHGGAAATAAVFKVLAMCRKQAAQNRGATAKQASGKLAPGRGTWQRSEKAASLRAGRAGQGVKFAPAPNAGDRQTVHVDTAKLEAGFKKDTGYHVPPGGGSDKQKYKAAAAFVDKARKTGQAVHQPIVTVDKSGTASFEDGRHRFAALRDAGHKTVAVSVESGQAAAVQARFGLAAQSAKGVKATKFHNAPGVTKPLLDVRRTDLPGQTSMFDRKPKPVPAARPGRPDDRATRALALKAARARGDHGTASGLKQEPIGQERIDAERRVNRGKRTAKNVKLIQDHLAAGGKSLYATHTKARLYNHPSHVKLDARGEMRVMAGKDYVAVGRQGEEQLSRGPRANLAAKLRAGRTVTARAQSPARERPDTLVKPPAAIVAHKAEHGANLAWNRAQALRAIGRSDVADKNFARHDELMRRAYKASGGKPAAAPPAKPGSSADFRAILEGSRRSGGARRDKRAQKLRRTREKVAAATRDPSTHTEHAPGTLTHLNTDLIHFDPERFQYKLAAQGSHGVTDALHGVKKWDPELGGVLQVWKDPANGKTFVVNGHHRLDLAKKLGAEKVATRFIDAKDAHEARAKGAITNIAEGRGSSTDAAKFFRDTGLSRQDLEGRGVPMREKVATEGLALSNLHEPIFHKVVNGEMTPARGAIIGDGLSHPQQASVLKMLGKLPPARQPTDKVLHAMVSHARHGPVTKQTTHDLFGSNEEDVSLALHRAEADSHIKDRLGREKRVFGTVAKTKNAEDLTRGGNVIDAEHSGRISDAASQNLATFDLLKHRSGPVSKLLNEAAERVHKGEKKKAVHDEIYGRLPAAVQAALAGG